MKNNTVTGAFSRPTHPVQVNAEEVKVPLDLKKLKRQFRTLSVIIALLENKLNPTLAAKYLGISRPTVYDIQRTDGFPESSTYFSLTEFLDEVSGQEPIRHFLSLVSRVSADSAVVLTHGEALDLNTVMSRYFSSHRGRVSVRIVKGAKKATVTLTSATTSSQYLIGELGQG